MHGHLVSEGEWSYKLVNGSFYMTKRELKVEITFWKCALLVSLTAMLLSLLEPRSRRLGGGMLFLASRSLG